MQIVEHSAQRLVIRHRRLGMAVAMAIFTFLSVFALVNLALQGLLRVDELLPLELLSWVAWLCLILMLVVFGAVAWLSTARGTTCIFDKTQAQIVIQRPRWLRMARSQHPIYAVAYVDVRHNAEAKVYGVFVVLRTGERIPLATVPTFDQPQVEQLVQDVRAFLR